MQEQIRIIIIEDHTMVRQLLTDSLADSGQIMVVGHWKSAEAALEFLHENKNVDIAIVDTHLPCPGMNGIQFLESARIRCPFLKFIILTMDNDELLIRGAFEAGASGYLLKTAPIEELKFAIQTVVRGQTYISAELTEHILFGAEHYKPAQQKALDLNGELIMMLEKARDGLGNKEIAEQLGLSLTVVKSRFARLMRRLNAKDRTETVIIALRKGLIGLHE
jgi:two-component system, NarL family, response regulator LiaR